MKKLYFLLFLLYSLFYFSQNKIQKDNSYNFYENKGQIIDQKGKQNKEVKYLYISNGLNVQLKKSGFSYDVYESERKQVKASKKSLENISEKEEPKYKITQKFHRVDIDFLNANPNVEIVAEDKSTDYDNYYNIPSIPKGVENVHRYRKVTYKNIYPNIDLEFFKPNDTLKPVEYNFIVKPGGKISNIQLKFKGAKTKLKDGKISMNLRFGEMQENIPNSWIEDLTSKKDIKINFKETGNQTFGFESSQDSFDKTVVIDPVPTRIWGSYFGGNGDEHVQGLKADADENLVIFGTTSSHNNIATTGVYQTAFSGVIGFSNFAAKFDKNSNKIWGTYIYDGNYSILHAVDINTDKEIFLAGESESDAVIYKLDPNGILLKNQLIHGSGDINITSISVASNSVFFAGTTRSSTEIATIGTYQDSYQNLGILGFIIKKDFQLNTLWGTYFGGSGTTEVLNSSIDDNENIQIYGVTNSISMPVKNPFQSTLAGYEDGFYANFNNDGDLKQSSFLGFGENDYLYNGKITKDNTLILIGCFDLNFNDRNDGIYNIDLSSNTILSKKYYNYRLDYAYWRPTYNTFIDEDNFIFLAGQMSATKIVATPNAYENTPLSNNPYLVKLDSKGDVMWGTNYGGAIGGFDNCFVTLDKNKNIYITGNASPPSVGANISTNGTLHQGGWDSFIAKFKDCASTIHISPNQTVCPGSDIKLEASGGATYSWTGPNGYTSSDQNPTISNATAINSGTYSCVISGTGDCDGTFSVDVKVEDKTPPVPNIANLPDISGDCNTLVSEIPTATDACAGNIIATTNSPLQYSMPGTYVVIWKYDDGHGNTSTQNQKVIVSSPALPTANPVQEFCSTENRTVGDLQYSGQNVKWYNSTGTKLDQNFKLVDGNYFATQTLNGCESNKLEIAVKINVTPLPTGDADQEFCVSQNAKISDLKVTGNLKNFYDSAGNILPTSTLLLDNTSYFVTQTINSCQSKKFEIKVAISQNALPATDHLESNCYGPNEIVKINLEDYRTYLISNYATYNFEFYDSNNQIITDLNQNLKTGENIFKVKVSSASGCIKFVKLTLNVNRRPDLNFPDEVEFCDGKSIILDAGAGYSTYLWGNGETTQTIKVNKEGAYVVTVTNSSGCKAARLISVKKSLLATILRVDISNTTATVVMSELGNYLYSLDQQNWQNSNVFSNLQNGNYEVFVKTEGGCNLGSKTFTIFNISNTFTPNGDGINDTWKIDGLENYPNSEVSVYDNQGKRVLFKITSGAFEWDGKLNSRVLPTGNYWYNIKVSDGRILNGYLLLKNRN